jgi:hypothetical protein
VVIVAVAEEEATAGAGAEMIEAETLTEVEGEAIGEGRDIQDHHHVGATRETVAHSGMLCPEQIHTCPAGGETIVDGPQLHNLCPPPREGSSRTRGPRLADGLDHLQDLVHHLADVDPGLQTDVALTESEEVGDEDEAQTAEHDGDRQHHQTIPCHAPHVRPGDEDRLPL